MWILSKQKTSSLDASFRWHDKTSFLSFQRKLASRKKSPLYSKLLIKRILQITLIAGLASTIFACGQSGKLYLPEPNQPTHQNK